MRIKLLLSIAAVLFTASFSNLHAQTDGKKREVGVQFSGFNFDGFTAFNALYRKQKSENVYRRIRATFGNISLLTAGEGIVSFNAGLAIGREKRRTLDRKLEFYRGPEFSASLGFLAGEVLNELATINLGFGYVLGLQHSFSDLWAIHLETVPGVNVGFIIMDEDGVLSLGAGFSSAVTLGVVRKF